MKQNENKALCPRMWQGLSDRDGESAYPCCRFDYFDEAGVRFKNFATIEAAYNSPFFQQKREQMLSGETPHECRRCSTEESVGIKSERSYALDSDPKFNPLSQKASLSSVTYLELFTGNTCNLRCHSCNPTSSSSWASEYRNLGWSWPREEQTTVLCENIEAFTSLTELKIIGGEPTLSPLFHNTIQKVKSKENIEIYISTNCTQFLSTDLIEQLKKFKKVWISLSIDGPQGVNDLIRYPSKWEQVELVAKKYIDLAQHQSNFRINLHTTVYLLNLTKLSALLNWWEFLTKDMKGCKYHLSLLQSPDFMSLQNITPEGVENILPKIKEDPRLKSIADFIESQAPYHGTTLPQLFSYCQQLDAQRKVDTSSLIKYLLR